MSMTRPTPRRRSERAMTLTSGQPLDRYPAARSCGFTGCAARLSSYNPNSTCAAHGGWQAETAPRRRRGN